MTPSYWPLGTEIMWRWGDFHVQPMRVVRDGPEGLVAWMPAGTAVLQGVRKDGRPPRSDKSTMFTTEQIQVEGTWERASVLRIVLPDRWWSVWLFFAERSDSFEGWYVNIEEPHRRDIQAHSTYTRDCVLDVWVSPDRTSVRKDEDELICAVEQGRYTQEQADAITAIADEIEGVLGEWGSPFSDGWETFQPDPAWPLPLLRP